MIWKMVMLYKIKNKIKKMWKKRDPALGEGLKRIISVQRGWSEVLTTETIYFENDVDLVKQALQATKNKA
jgi:hypothetical protein